MQREAWKHDEEMRREAEKHHDEMRREGHVETIVYDVYHD